jgi:hypothetical protein
MGSRPGFFELQSRIGNVGIAAALEPVMGYLYRIWQLSLMVVCVALTPGLHAVGVALLVVAAVLCGRSGSILDYLALIDDSRAVFARPSWTVVRWIGASACDWALAAVPMAFAMTQSFGVDPFAWLVSMAVVSALTNATTTWWLGQPTGLRIWIKRWRLPQLVYIYRRLVVVSALYHVYRALPLPPL